VKVTDIKVHVIEPGGEHYLGGIAGGFGRRFQGHAAGPPLHQAANLHLMGGISSGGFFETSVPEGINSAAMKDVITLEADGCVTIPPNPDLVWIWTGRR